MSAENAPSTTPSLTAEQRLQREAMMLNGLGGDVSEDRAQAVLNYSATTPETTSEAPVETPVVETAAEIAAAQILQEFDTAGDIDEEPSEAAAIAAEAQRTRSERSTPDNSQKELARLAAHRSLNLMASEAAGRNGRELDQAELDARHEAIDKQYS